MNDEMIIPEEAEVASVQDTESTLPQKAESPSSPEGEEPNSEISSLEAEISSLKEQLSALKSQRDAHERMLREVEDFTQLFPHIELDTIPESVWENVRAGTPLSAAYALYERRIHAQEERIARINSSNASRSAGIAGKDAASEYFSPEDVRKMSSAEVHANYSKIKQSMKKWMEN